MRPRSHTANETAWRAIVAVLCVIGSIGPAMTSRAGNAASGNAPDLPAADGLVTVSDVVGQLPDPDATSFAPGELIVRLRPRAGRLVESARTVALAPAMPGDPAAAQLDAILRRHQSKKMRRVFRVYEDADGRQTDTAQARLQRVRSRRAKSSGRPLPPPPAHTPDLENFFLVEMDGLDTADELDAVMADLGANELVASVQPNYVYRSSAHPLPAVGTVPDDPFVSRDGATWSEGSFGNDFPDLYGVRNLRVLETWSLLDTDGNGSFDADETAPGEGVVVAVIDSGLDSTHLDIAGGLFVNPGEIPGDGVDNDANGLVDDVSGWDFVADDPIPEDANGHGSHVAGTVAASSNNAEGIVGVAPFARILPLKGLGDGGSGTSSDLAAAVNYAADVGADITSNSWGGLLVDELLRATFDNARASGVLSFAAAGNSGHPRVSSPALFDSVVAVAAVDESDRLASFSNWGPDIEVCAPGVQVLSLSANEHQNRLAEETGRTVGDRYLWLNGTSMSTPHASGTAALLMSLHPTESAAGIRGRLLQGALPIDAHNPGRENGLGTGRVDAFASAVAAPVPLLRVTDIRQGAIVAGEVATIDVEIRSLWLPATGVHASLTTSDPDVSIVDGERNYGDLANGEAASRTFEIAVAPGAERGSELHLLLTIGADGSAPRERPFTVRGGDFVAVDHLANLSPFPFFVVGSTFGDYDGDALLDMGIGTIFAATHLYRQQPDGTFDDHQPNGSGFARNPIFADMNNDGLLDLLAVGAASASSSVLGVNVGDGQFEVLPASSGFQFPPGIPVTGFTPIDLDADGDLDVIGGLRRFISDDQGPSRNIVVLRNDGDLTFTEAWAETGLARNTGATQFLTLDWNGDGLTDLFGLTEFIERVSLHRNLGRGRFEDVTDVAFPDDLLTCPTWSRGRKGRFEIPGCERFRMATAGDYDSDGDTDLLLAVPDNLNAGDGSALRLFANDGAGVFSEVTDQAGDLATVHLLSGWWGLSFFDLENDGDLDIVVPIDIVLAGTPARQPETTVVILRNDGQGHFTNVSDTALPRDKPLASLVTAVGDFDGDGTQDLLAPVGNIVGLLGGLMRNLAGRDHGWLEVELEPLDSAPNGYGAQLTLVADGRVQTREIRHAPVEPWRVHFGLGDAAIADVLEVRWPSGVVGLQRDVAVDRRITVREDLPCPELPDGRCPVVAIDVDPASDENRIVTGSSGHVIVAILGSGQLDAAEIDPTRSFFGPGRSSPSHAGGHLGDVNGDGLLDWFAHFRIPEAGIEPGDVEACLRSQLLDRTPIAGCDQITTHTASRRGHAAASQSE